MHPHIINYKDFILIQVNSCPIIKLRFDKKSSAHNLRF